MAVAGLIVFVIHILTKPYVKEYINIIEAFILLDIMLVAGAFIDLESDIVTPVIGYIFMFIPYLYFLVYICYFIIKYIM